MVPNASRTGAGASAFAVLAAFLAVQPVSGIATDAVGADHRALVLEADCIEAGAETLSMIQSAKSRISAAIPDAAGSPGGASAGAAKVALEEAAAEVQDSMPAGNMAVVEELLTYPTEQGKLERIGCLWGPKTKWSSSPIAGAKWTNALVEEGVDADSVSLFGCAVPKMPISWVQRIQALDHTKIHDYNFLGTWMWEYYRETLPRPIWHAWHKEILGADSTSRGEPQARARDWVVAFARANFTDRDYFKVTDADEFYQKLGSFDVSEPKQNHDIRSSNGSKWVSYVNDFDESYWQILSSSKFTLCPGGDNPWSMRFFEAIASGSIPVIASSRYDVGMPILWALWDIPYHYYNLETGDELIYREDWVEENLRLFVKYQTFHEGDNVPPHTFNVTRRLLQLKKLLPVEDGEGAFFGNGAKVPAPLVDEALSPAPEVKA